MWKVEINNNYSGFQAHLGLKAVTRKKVGDPGVQIHVGRVIQEEETLRFYRQGNDRTWVKYEQARSGQSTQTAGRQGQKQGDSQELLRPSRGVKLVWGRQRYQTAGCWTCFKAKLTLFAGGLDLSEEWKKEKGLGREEQWELVLDIPSPRKLEDRKGVSRGYSSHRTGAAHPANVHIEKEVPRMGSTAFQCQKASKFLAQTRKEGL